MLKKLNKEKTLNYPYNSVKPK